ncbi:MAG TPA: hypothetical protein VK149_08115 [Sideroxyarcus sp.]|nr:hypothetical protein [Sideroxyarcus sp.]
MLTVDKLKTYAAFDGDIDGWARSSISPNKDVMEDADWYLINELLMGLIAVDVGNTSETFLRDLENKINTSTADQACRDALRKLAAHHRGNKQA